MMLPIIVLATEGSDRSSIDSGSKLWNEQVAIESMK